MLNIISLKWDTQAKAKWNGLFAKAKILVVETKECWADLRTVKMESKVSSNVEKQNQIARRFAKSYVKSAQEHDRSIN